MRRLSTSNIKFLSIAEKKELYNAIDRDQGVHAMRNQAMFHIAKYCAMRASEVGLLEMSDYDCVSKSLHIRRLKGSRSNTLKIVDPFALNSFEQYYWQRKSLALNTSKLFTSQLGLPISRKTLDFIMKKYCAHTNIPDDKWHFHVLKHTRAMELIEYPSIELRDVQWWLGHKNIQNTMLYLDYSVTTMALLFDKIKLEEGCN